MQACRYGRIRALQAVALALIIFPLADSPARGDAIDQEVAKFASGSGTTIFMAAGTGLPLVTDGRRGKEHTLRTLDALGTSIALSEGLKALTREQRPNGKGHDSFPSGHATNVFAIATMQSQFHPKQALWWYSGATLIAASRLTLHEHTFGDVLAGALLGYGTARLELSMPHGLILAPFIPRSDHGAGVQLSVRF